MSNKKTKTIVRIINFSDFEKEEKLFREQHSKGWKLVSLSSFGTYTFEACEEEDVIYQADYADMPNDEKDSYLQMFADFGWEYVCELNGFIYFRKPVANHTEDDLTIFSDKQSKLNMIKTLQKKKLLPLSAIFLLLIIPNILRLHNQITEHAAYSSAGDYVLFWTYIVMFVLYICIIVYSLVRFGKMEKQLKEK
ncbi:MAG: DUF2812 domain-containing protein [Lachnospira sp.]|nr:DUF2812 domain-containing protein [Lachnospira sp.]